MEEEIITVYCVCDELLQALRRPIRKKNSQRPFPPWIEFLQQAVRKRIETTGSQITALFPKKIHAVTPQGFELKVMLFVLAFAFQCL